MAFRPQVTPHAVISNGNMSGSITSGVTIIQKISMLSYSYSWSGSSPVGTISVEISNDYSLDGNGQVKNAGTWTTIPFIDANGDTVTSFDVSGNTGNGQVDIETAAYAVRTLYTRTSGSGTLQCLACGKVS